METRQEWEKIKELFGAALELDPDERGAFLQAACGTDVSLRQEVESLIKAHESSSHLWQGPLQLPSPETAEGRCIGPYQLLKKIGEGGMGQVWLAEQSAPLQRRLALKLIRWGVYDDTVLHRFQAERQSLAVMDHPAIAKVFDAGATLEGQPYFVMEYVAGVPITNYCDQKRLEIRERLELFIKVCEGVQHAHQKAIIHRDLKPPNILVVEVDGKPVPRIIDFGLAKTVGSEIAGESLHTSVGSFVGTPGYMSPEQCDPAAQDIDTRTDVYSLGMVLYVLLAGSLPFDAKEWKNKPLDEMLRRLREEDPPRPSTKVSTDRETSSTTAEARGTELKELLSLLRGDLDWITMKAAEKDRTRRYGTASELAADIRRYLSNEPVSARPASVSYRVQKYVRRHRYAVSAATVIIGLLIASAVMENIQLRKTRRERDRADRIADFMTGIFKVSDPEENIGSTVTAREVLDKASNEIDTGLANDPEIQSRMMSEMGIAYMNLGLYARAQSLFERSIRIGSSPLGPEHPTILKTTHELAWTLFRQRKLAEAEAQQRKLVDVERRVLGPQHPDTVGAMGDLATTLHVEGHLADAEKMQREVWEAQKRLLGPEAHYTLISADNLASILAAEGRLTDAAKLEQETLETQRRVFGPENLTTIHFTMNEAAIKSEMGEDEEAEEMLRQALAHERRVLDPHQPEIAVTLYQLATVALKRGRNEEALSLLSESIDVGLLPGLASGIGEDADLKALHGDTRFSALVAHAKQVAAHQQRNSP